MPLFKKGKRNQPSNYRPIALTSQIVKIFEKCIINKIKPFLSRTGLIKPCQHGFQDKASCISQLLECMEEWTTSFDRKTSTDIIYLDFAKAFDTVPHERLLAKLHAMGIQGNLLKWLRTFLTCRYQRVQLRNGGSSWTKVISGVPQGSILGPTLFLLYINDLPDHVHSQIKLFADDTKIYRNIFNISDCHSLQNDLAAMAEWSRQWLLSFNETKCVVLRLRKTLEFIYSLNSTPLNEVPHQKDLGVHISNNLHPRHHILEITKSANKRLGLIKRCFSTRNKDTLSILYKSIVRPVLEYGSPVWSPWLKKDKELLDKVQTNFSKICNNTDLEPLTSRRERCDLVETYKFLNHHYKTNPQTFFQRSQLQLRGHSFKLKKQHSYTDTRKHFFSNRVVNPWNQLPEETVTAPSLDAFKNHLRSLPHD